MRLMQDEQPIEYHVIQWRNSAFHNHAVLGKRKMLGGVSFDGGAISGGGQGGKSITHAGVNESQPPFSHISEENAVFGRIGSFGAGLGNSVHKSTADNEKVTKTQYVKESIDIGKNKDKDIEENTYITGSKYLKEESLYDKLAGVLNITGEGSFSEEIADKDGRIRFIRGVALKLGKGIGAFLRKDAQNSEMQSRQKPKKKITNGTRPVTKEDVYDIQVNSSYLLESYNRNGERSTLGK
ncbi:MAG: hypothetical protein J1D87_10420 [Lachnospiraceae bacterium]|nr:hypothetical protein [Lachnospiraceae bacterium]